LLYSAFAVDTVPNLELTPGSTIKQDWQACELNRGLYEHIVKFIQFGPITFSKE